MSKNNIKKKHKIVQKFKKRNIIVLTMSKFHTWRYRCFIYLFFREMTHGAEVAIAHKKMLKKWHHPSLGRFN